MNRFLFKSAAKVQLFLQICKYFLRISKFLCIFAAGFYKIKKINNKK